MRLWLATKTLELMEAFLLKVKNMKGLVIRSPWIDLILAGNKIWEMRTKPTSIRGRIALIKAGSGMIFGTAELVDCLPALARDAMHAMIQYHGIPMEQIESAIENRWTTPWVLADIVRFERPMPYVHPSGAVTWVELKETPAEGERSRMDSQERKIDDNSLGKWIDIPLSDGNIRNGHFYLRTAVSLLPANCIGGSNKSHLAKVIEVRFDNGYSITSDVAGDKMILRSRGPIKEFFDRTGAKGGDHLRFEKAGDREFLVRIQKSSEGPLVNAPPLKRRSTTVRIQSKVSRGAKRGITLLPHLHTDGMYVVSMSRFQKDYVRVGTLEEIANHLAKGFSVRMSNAGEGVASASLISPASITVSQ